MYSFAEYRPKALATGKVVFNTVNKRNVIEATRLFRWLFQRQSGKDIYQLQYIIDMYSSYTYQTFDLILGVFV
mgnify:CR=1 FL=1